MVFPAGEGGFGGGWGDRVVRTAPDPGRAKQGGVVEYEDRLKEGDFFRIIAGGPLYQVHLVNESRALCFVVKEIHPTGRLQAEGELGSVQFGGGDGINISPFSAVMRVEDPRLALQQFKEQRRVDSDKVEEMSIATIPGATKSVKSVKEKEAARRQSLASKKVAGIPGAEKIKRPLTGAAAAAKANAKKNTTPKESRSCVCGCGQQTFGYFAPGHDARFKGWMIKVERGGMPVNELPKSVQKAFNFVKKGKGFVTTHNYKGEKHSGYATN